MCSPNGIVAILAATLVAGVASAQSYMIDFDEELVGDWSCGDARVYVTQLGSIEILDSGYRAGRFEVSGDQMVVDWDEGGKEIWGYVAEQGEITLTSPDGEEVLGCRPR
jgi:hypothetical protein